MLASLVVNLVALDNELGGVVWQKSIGAAKGRSEIERLVDVDGMP